MESRITNINRDRAIESMSDKMNRDFRYWSMAYNSGSQEWAPYYSDQMDRLFQEAYENDFTIVINRNDEEEPLEVDPSLKVRVKKDGEPFLEVYHFIDKDRPVDIIFEIPVEAIKSIKVA